MDKRLTMDSRNIRFILILGIVCMTGITVLMMFTRLNEPRPTVKIIDEQFDALPVQPQIPLVIAELNEINSQVSGFDGSDVSVKIWENGMRFKISGSMSYEKPNNFRMKVWSIMGQEMDIGSNESLFWYWSRRDRYPGLYYAAYGDYHKTRLKTPFNPVFMRESLGLNEIDATNAKIVENEKHVMVSWQKTNASNEKILYSVLVNRLSKRIDGIVISDLSSKVIASCEIEYQGILPKKILYDWKEEQKSLVIEFSNPTINKKFSSSNWDLPRYSPKIDMGKE